MTIWNYTEFAPLGPRFDLVHSSSTSRRATCAILFFIGLLSFDNFNPMLFGGLAPNEVSPSGSGATFQQIGTVGLWITVIAISLLPGALLRPSRFNGLFWPVVLLSYLLASSLWSSEPGATALKATALLLCSMGAWRAASIITVEAFFTCFTYSLSALVLASAIVAIFVPSIGVAHYWQHEGLWEGVFEQKQGLGTASAYLTFTTLVRLSYRRKLFDVAACAMSLLCLAQSGSRGGAVMAAMAVVCLLLARKYDELVPFLTSILIVELILANVVILIFAWTGYKYIFLFGNQIDITERTFIWQFAINSWLNHFTFGYGLNGFWTDPALFYGFLRNNQWVLDNYHNGYIAVMVETGIIGMLLFTVVVVKLATRLRSLLQATHGSRLGLELTLGFLVLFFTINLTETFFLRSTSFIEITFTFLVVKVFTSHYVSVRQLRGLNAGAR